MDCIRLDRSSNSEAFMYPVARSDNSEKIQVLLRARQLLAILR